MRQIIIFITLASILFGMYRLSQTVQGWHYVVPATAGEVIYATSFDGDMPDWLQDERAAFSHVIHDGALRITANADRVGPYSLVRPHFDRFDFRVTARIVDGDFSGGDNNAFGIVFRRVDAQNYYVFLISGDGYYRVQRVVNNRQREISAWNPSDAIRQGVGGTNRLRVVGHGDQFRFYVNDAPLELCIPDDPDDASTINTFSGECIGGEWRAALIDSSHRAGQVGVVVDAERAGPLSTGSPIIIDFDDVIITGAEDLTEDAS